jgi:hypothetical protein
VVIERHTLTIKETKTMKILCIGDAMIPGVNFKKACDELKVKEKEIAVDDWENDSLNLQNRRLVIEKQGPAAEPVLPMIQKADKNTEMLLVLYAPVSADALDAMPSLRLVGAARAGQENVDVKAATERGIVVHNIMGRNAQAVSDFAIGLLFAEARNIARAHQGIKQADFISLHARLTDSTKGLIGKDVLKLMKPTSILINTARAGLIDDEALYESSIVRLSIPAPARRAFCLFLTLPDRPLLIGTRKRQVSFSGCPSVTSVPMLSGRSWRECVLKFIKIFGSLNL